MREILFKAKRIDNGEWVEGYYTKTKYGHYISFGDEVAWCCALRHKNINQINPETISQFTGLKDKHGNKIFENDIVKWGHFNTIERPIRIAKVEMKPDIRFNSNVGVFQYGEFAYQDTENYLEVIGNKFDNPELLEKVEEL